MQIRLFVYLLTLFRLTLCVHGPREAGHGITTVQNVYKAVLNRSS